MNDAPTIIKNWCAAAGMPEPSDGECHALSVALATQAQQAVPVAQGDALAWVKAADQLPPCRDENLYIGVNSAGFAGVFNAVADIAGDVYCMYETPEGRIDVMSGVEVWKPFTPPAPAQAKEGA